MKTKHLLTAFLTLGLAATSLFAAPKDGDLVMSPTGAIFVIRDGKRCQIPSMEVFGQGGFKLEKVIKVSDEEVNAIPAGPAFTAAAKPQAQNAPAARKDGDLVMSPGGAIFVIRDGKRCQIPSMDVFHASGFKMENIIKISDADVNAIPQGSAVTMPYTKPKDGDLVKAGSETVYVIQSGKRCVIPSIETFKAKGYKAEKIIVISDAELEAIPKGQTVE